MSPHYHYLDTVHVYAKATDDAPEDKNHLHGDRVVGEAVCMSRRWCWSRGALLSPSLETVVEDEKAKREEEEENGGGVKSED